MNLLKNNFLISRKSLIYKELYSNSEVFIHAYSMAQSPANVKQEPCSNENSISTKEFLQFEKTCEAFKDSDEEIKMIFDEITKLTGANNNNNNEEIIGADIDDVEKILKRAEDIANETENILKTTPITSVSKNNSSNAEPTIPQITVTKPTDNKENHQENKLSTKTKANQSPVKENSNDEVRRKQKTRPFSAGVIDSKKRETVKVPKCTSSSPKKNTKQESLIEDLKNTKERLRSLELLNVQLTEDNKMYRKKLDQVNEQKHVADLKLVECEKFISRIGKQYENRNSELKIAKENESKLLAELNKEKNERKNLTILHEKDNIVIHDLQRQVKEMELILRRKHPDSVSALIVASKSSTVDDNKKKLLEERTTRLEQELKDKESHFQGILLTLQDKFGEMKNKYENHIVDVERQLMEERKVNVELKNKINRATLVDKAIQTIRKPQNTTSTQTIIKQDRASSAVSMNRMTQNSTLLMNKLREDSYLIATIKGLQAELTVKQRTIAKINRETEELRKNLRNLQKEKEVLMNLNPQKKFNGKPAKSTENIARMNIEMETELEAIRKEKHALVLERSDLLDSLKRNNEELITLKRKRIQDLHTLQIAHEKELIQMNMQIYPLQEEIKLLNRTVEILQDRMRATEDKLLRYQGNIKDVEVHGGGDTRGLKNGIRRDVR